MKFLSLVTAVVAAFTTTSCAAPTAEPEVEANELTKRAGGQFQAFYGDNCDAQGGDVVGFSNNNCIVTQDRHSFRVNGCNAKFLMWSEKGCKGTWKEDYVGDGGCYHVNTGINWGSIGIQCA